MLLSVTSPAALTRKSGSSFYYSFLLLPKEKRRAIFALYSFCRVVDDCVDEEGGGGAAGLDSWLREIDLVFRSTPETPLGKELARALRTFPMPRSSFEEIVAGCRMDLATSRYETFGDLEVYCRRVASAVGLAAIEIFSYRDPKTREYAARLGIALQLTNILRDLGADGRRGRLYLPLEDLRARGVDPDAFLALTRSPGPRPPAVAALLAFEADRAREHHLAAAGLLPRKDRRSMVAAEVMRVTYRALLEEVVARGFPLFGEKVRLSAPWRATLALRTLVAGFVS
jgi:phytoene synthase